MQNHFCLFIAFLRYFNSQNKDEPTMLHVPSMLTYGFLSFILAFFNKALFELANFRYSLFVIFSQLIFILLSFQLLAYIRLLTIPNLTKTDLSTLLIPSIFYCFSTILSLQALMKLNVAIYVVIKVSWKVMRNIFVVFVLVL